MKTGFQKFEWQLQMSSIRQHQYLEVIRNCALALFAEYKRNVVADNNVAWWHKHDNTVNPPAAGCLVTSKCTSILQAAN